MEKIFVNNVSFAYFHSYELIEKAEKIILKWLLLPLFFLFLNTGNAQQIRYLGTADGLNGRQVFNFGQDKDGFIWISNRFGVDRFDGKKIKNYLLPILNKSKYPVREVHLLFDNDSILWCYTDNGGIYTYNRERDDFEELINLGFYLKTLVFDNENNIWFGANNTFGQIKNKHITVFKTSTLKNQLVRKILKYDTSNYLIISTKSVLLFNFRNQKISKLFDKNGLNFMSEMQIESAYYDTLEKQLWIGTTNSGLLVYNEKNKSFVKVNNANTAYNPILSIYPVDKSHLFLSTDGLGASLLDKKNLNIVQTYTQQANRDFALSGNSIYDVFKDREGRIWMSIFSDGVNIIELKKEGFFTIRHENNNPNSLYTNVVTHIIEDSQHNIWFGTHKGVSLYNRQNNQWKHLLNTTIVITMIEDSEQNIWVGTYSSGVYVFDINGNLKKQYLKSGENKNSIGTNFVYTLFEDSNKNIWIGGIKGPLSKFERKTNSFKQFQLQQINNIIQLKLNQLLIGTVSGLYFLSLNDDTHKPWKFNENLKSKCIFDILEDEKNTVWLTSYGGGLSKCDLMTGELKNYTTKNGLASDIAFSVVKDDQQNLWISSENGISKLISKTDSIINFSTGDGISDLSFRPLSRMKSFNGDIYFGSYNGVTRFNTKEINYLPSKSKLVFTDFSLFNRITHPNEKNSPLNETINNTDKLDLNYKDHSFSLSFTTINFSSNLKRRYMWKLEGLDNEWIGPSSETVVNYTNLSPKTYIFKLKAIGDNNIVLDQRELEVVIHPPFWNTFLAKMIAFVLLILIIYWTYNYLSSLYEKRRTTEKIKFFINTTHDLRTPLTLISSPIYELKERLVLDKWDKYLLDLVTSNLEKMNKMVSQLLDFQKTYESQEKLIVSKNNVNQLLTDKKMLWSPVAERKNIQLKLELPENNLFEWYDKEKMDKILDNLISNAIKYTKKDGRVDIKFSGNSNYWQINVVDNGIGIPKSAVKNLFHRFYRANNAINSQETGSGLGLLLIKNYVSLHKGKIGLNSTENQGSDFYIRFNRGNKQYKNYINIDQPEMPVSKESSMSNDSEIIEKQKIKLLIVEDNNDLREYVKLSLSHYFITYTAENGLDAWNKIPTINPDIILSDYNMPEMNGFELCEKIKKTFETSHIPVILLTVMTDEQHVEEGFKLGADDYIEKPFDVKYLKLKIDNIINNRRILRTKFLNIDKNSDSEDILENDLNQIFLTKATNIVEEHISDTTFSISDFSREMGVSKSLLYNKFNAMTGYTPNDFIKITRMKKAVVLLKEGKYSINEVASLTGFDEASYFTTCFKKTYGKSPKQFVKDEL